MVFYVSMPYYVKGRPDEDLGPRQEVASNHLDCVGRVQDKSSSLDTVRLFIVLQYLMTMCMILYFISACIPSMVTILFPVIHDPDRLDK